VLAITHTFMGLGITVGYHLVFAHRSCKTTRTVQALLAVLGSRAVEGPVIETGRHLPQAPQLLRPPRRPHSPPWTIPPGWRGELWPSPMTERQQEAESNAAE
jgi:stearoyl-CoA desaturase (Delta-9 desaturase)